MTKEQRIFNVAEFSEKARKALNKLESEQQAGQLISGGKQDIVRAVKTDIKALLEKGYTTQQVADAFKNDVFGILPKTITQIINENANSGVTKRKSVKRTKSKQENNKPENIQGNKETRKQSNEIGIKKETGQQTSAAGTFVIKPDRQDV